jgi:hypothetical protein
MQQCHSVRVPGIPSPTDSILKLWRLIIPCRLISPLFHENNQHGDTEATEVRINYYLARNLLYRSVFLRVLRASVLISTDKDYFTALRSVSSNSSSSSSMNTVQSPGLGLLIFVPGLDPGFSNISALSDPSTLILVLSFACWERLSFPTTTSPGATAGLSSSAVGAAIGIRRAIRRVSGGLVEGMGIVAEF